MNQLGGGQTRSLWYVDTGPVLERDFAQRAGLGFIGKHTNVISRQFGNWILPGGNSHHARTGTGRAGEEPLRHLHPLPRRLPHRAPSPRRSSSMPGCCISYLTIELKGSIPVELRPAIGNRIYGCDDCLAACPWNRFAREGKMMKAHARAGPGRAGLAGIAATG